MLDEMRINDVQLNASDIGQFLKQPTGGASVQRLRKVSQTYSGTNGVYGPIETVRAFHQHHGASFSNGSGDERSVSRIKGEDLKLVCNEYIHA